MESRPVLCRNLDSKTFRDYYYLKEELVAFCRDNQLPTSGGKQELTERIVCFLDTGNVVKPIKKRAKAQKTTSSEITRQSTIEEGFVCSEKHRAFSEQRLAIHSLSTFNFKIG